MMIRKNKTKRRNAMVNILEKITNFVSEMGFNIALLIGGVLGGFLRIRKNNKPIWESITYVAISAIASNYLSPIILHFLNMSENTLGGIGFVIGYMQLSILDLASDKIKEKINDI